MPHHIKPRSVYASKRSNGVLCGKVMVELVTVLRNDRTDGAGKPSLCCEREESGVGRAHRAGSLKGAPY